MAQAESSTMTQTNGIAGIVERLARVVQWLAAPWLVNQTGLSARTGAASANRTAMRAASGRTDIVSFRIVSDAPRMPPPGGPAKAA